MILKADGPKARPRVERRLHSRQVCHFAAGPRGEGFERDLVDGLGDELDGAVAHRELDAAGVVAGEAGTELPNGPPPGRLPGAGFKPAPVSSRQRLAQV